MGREVRGGSRWGTHINPWMIHVNVWQKPLQYCKVISLQLIKINGKKKDVADTHIYAIEYYSTIKTNATKSFAAAWTDLEIITLSEVSQTEK